MPIGGLLGGEFKELGLRFNLVGLIPTTLTVLYVIALVSSGAPWTEPNIQSVLNRARGLDTKDLVLLMIFIVPLTLVLQPLQLSLVRVLEGYWGDGWMGKHVSSLGIGVHRRRRSRIEELAGHPMESKPGAEESAVRARAALRLKQLFPSEERLLPTRLGNLLRAAEERAGSDYALDAVLVWPWLYPLLPASVTIALEDHRNQLDFCLRTCACFLFAALISAVFLIDYMKWLAVPAACLLMAWVSYRAALAAALGYGTQMRVAVSLHRFDLLGALHLALPVNDEEERRANRDLCTHLYQVGKTVHFTYMHEIPRPSGGEIATGSGGTSREEAG